MKTIPLSQGLETLVDDTDYEWLSQFKWYAQKNGRTFYARRRAGKIKIDMHRYILYPPENKEVDHIDGNGLNNQKENLRVVTRRENLQNRHHKKTSVFVGVSWCKEMKKWHAQIYVCKTKNLGYFNTQLEAHEAYKNALIEHEESIK